ncbi:hypothetical protein DFQ01_109116 [Paenibacillus cellulosilyticus]|uniref:Uncharacterized protein n=2 Tax=Paenibacillus cellulosilyticus TaxID=375489 RepID=A0A2V2YTQ8_9BACL|nr:hypothetical protein [Paenibacillus cellulosilyticus]PWW02491.1 hypothetical protein DFQ01_109116 [Paenibacillus cellulosilyticus]
MQPNAHSSQLNRQPQPCTSYRFVRRLYRRSEGAVTVFFIVVTAMILLLGTILIDYARIAAFNTLTEHAVRTSVRSVLSAYDAALYERYGLFGRGGTPGETIFERSLRGTLEYDGGGSGYRPVVPQVDGFTVEDAAYLGRYDVLDRQILEEMKIKAPVDFMIDIGSRFTSMSQLMKESSTTSDALSRAGKLYDKRQKALLEALDKMRAIAQLATGAMTGEQASSLAEGYASYDDWKTSIESISLSISRVQAQLSTGTNLSDSEKKALNDSISSKRRQKQAYQDKMDQYESSMRSIAASLNQQAAQAQSELPSLKQSALELIAQAEGYNREIQTAVTQAESATAAGYDEVSSQSEDADQSGNSIELRKIRQSTEQLVLEDEWFAAFRNEVEQQAVDLKAVIDAAFRFASSAQQVGSGGGGSEASLAAEASSMKQAYTRFSQRYISPASVISQRESLIQSANAVDEQRKKDEAEAKEIMNDTKNLMPSSSTNGMTDEERDLYKQVQARYDANRLFNSAADEAAELAAQWADNVEGQQESSNAMMGSLFNGLADMLSGTRDTLYTGEYVLHRFQTYAAQLQASSAGGSGSNTVGNATAFANQEAEYILYGFDQPGANAAAAIAEIFGVRFAIRLMEGFIECRSLGHPLLVLSGALLYAARNSALDMKDLMQRGATKLSKFADVDVQYKDYLRLFMLLHSGGDKRLSRIAAVIETNTGTDLSRTPAAVSASADVSIKLLFLPGAMSVLGTFGLLQGRVTGNRYETTKLAGMAY